MLIVQINPFRPNPIHPETGSYYFRISSQIFSQSGLAGGGGDFFLPRGPETALGRSENSVCLFVCARARHTLYVEYLPHLKAI